MKKSIFILALATIAVFGTFAVGCKSAAQKNEAARLNVIEANKDLKVAQIDAKEQKRVNAEEWKAFKLDSEAKIKSNETLIAELKVKMNEPGNKPDAHYQKRILNIEERNTELKIRMSDYENDPNRDWDTFKREFNRDMSAIGKAFSDLTTNNKN
ncbi:MAG: hypothetical protein U1C58_13015 [Flavobacteriaceae bacterium]|nr:hypothetical protein [Flavobacteriaceae bacterium]